MTTIATDGKTIAADSACTGNGILHCEVQKISSLKDGSVFGMTGTMFDMATFAAWYDDGAKGDPGIADNFEALVLKPNGTVLCFNHKGRHFVHPTPAACGSGAPVAYGAMDAGATPEEAVRIASARDCGSGGLVWSLKPGRSTPRSRKKKSA